MPIELLDLEDLLYKIDNDEDKNNRLFDLIIKNRTHIITKAIKEDSKISEKLNKRALRNKESDNLGKRKRNRIIAEVAKIKADYTCEATGKKSFKMPNGSYYVEAHHILEFSTENGPDITDNLIVLGVEKHKLIHVACQQEIEDLYNHLKTHGIITIDRFVKMHEVYKCLTKKHVQILFNKKLISSIDKEYLLELIDEK